MTPLILIEDHRCQAQLAVHLDDAADVRTARRAFGQIMRTWGLDPDHPVVDSALVILSELLTNVYRHTRPLTDTADITLTVADDRMILRAHDRHPLVPRLPDAAQLPPETPADGLGGRGLQLITGLTAAAGGLVSVIRDPDDQGKTIRVELPLGDWAPQPPPAAA